VRIGEGSGFVYCFIVWNSGEAKCPDEADFQGSRGKSGELDMNMVDERVG